MIDLSTWERDALLHRGPTSGTLDARVARRGLGLFAAVSHNLLSLERRSGALSKLPQLSQFMDLVFLKFD
jgi:hypothetical protein